MGYIQNFAKAVSLSGKKKGRRPVMNAQQFYPRGLERELQQKTEAEFERILRELTEVALVGYSGNFDDDIGDLMNNPLDFSEEFKNAVDNIMKRTDVHAHANFSRQAELIIGAPYYPPGTAEGILNDWKSTFLSYCKSAGEQQKTKIATIVLEGKEKGWNKVQLEKEIMSRLDPQFQNRAELIARTELGKLNSRITLETYKSVGVEYYKWLTTIDGRERESHAELNDVICSVSDPDVYFEENEKNPLSPIQKMRTATMYHGHPGTDFQCRCSMVMWDPEIDGQYKVKESDYEERKASEEAEKQAEEKADAEQKQKEENEKRNLEEKANKARLNQIEAERRLRLMTAANERHISRSYESAKEIKDRFEKRVERTKNYNDVIETAKKNGAEYLEPKKMEKLQSEEEIIKKLGGGDLTTGSCSSLALAYAGNKAGYDVIDFRGGGSLNTFCRGSNIKNIVKAGGFVEQQFDGFKSASAVLDKVEEGKEYYFATAQHAAVVRKNNGIFEYLELQSGIEEQNGFHKLDNKVLRNRFGSKKSRSFHGLKIPYTSYLIDFNSLKDSPKFRELMGYINTEASNQKKGSWGGMK